jgi:hypothetical protein
MKALFFILMLLCLLGGSHGQLGEEWSGDSGREDSTRRREGSGQSDGIWCKPKGDNEAVTNPKEMKRWRNEQSIERDDRSSWRRKEVVCLKSDFPQYLKYEVLFCPVVGTLLFLVNRGTH